MKVKSKVWLEKDGELVFGSGRAAILKAVAETGSINKAAREMKMSYRHAWSYIRSAERRLGRQLVICTKGGINGGSTKLTPYGKELTRKIFNLEQRVKSSADKLYKEIFI